MAMLSPMTFAPKSRPALTTSSMVSSCACPMTTTMTGSGLRRHLRLQPAAVHDFQIRNNRHIRITRPQFPNAAHAFGNDERRAGFEPVHARSQSDLGGIESFTKID